MMGRSKTLEGKCRPLARGPMFQTTPAGFVRGCKTMAAIVGVGVWGWVVTCELAYSEGVRGVSRRILHAFSYDANHYAQVLLPAEGEGLTVAVFEWCPQRFAYERIRKMRFPVRCKDYLASMFRGDDRGTVLLNGGRYLVLLKGQALSDIDDPEALIVLNLVTGHYRCFSIRDVIAGSGGVPPGQEDECTRTRIFPLRILEWHEWDLPWIIDEEERLIWIALHQPQDRASYWGDWLGFQAHWHPRPLIVAIDYDKGKIRKSLENSWMSLLVASRQVRYSSHAVESLRTRTSGPLVAGQDETMSGVAFFHPSSFVSGLNERLIQAVPTVSVAYVGKRKRGPVAFPERRITLANSQGRVVLLVPGDGKQCAQVRLFPSWLPGRDVYRAQYIQTLHNPVCPGSVAVSPSGRYLVTFEDAGTVGYGPRVIVIYDMARGRSRTFALEEFLSPKERREHVIVLSERLHLWRWGDGRINIVWPEGPAKVGTDAEGQDDWVVRVDVANMTVTWEAPRRPAEAGKDLRRSGM